jgi:hypothetical protein
LPSKKPTGIHQPDFDDLATLRKRTLIKPFYSSSAAVIVIAVAVKSWYAGSEIVTLAAEVDTTPTTPFVLSAASA